MEFSLIKVFHRDGKMQFYSCAHLLVVAMCYEQKAGTFNQSFILQQEFRVYYLGGQDSQSELVHSFLEYEL